MYVCIMFLHFRVISCHWLLWHSKIQLYFLLCVQQKNESHAGINQMLILGQKAPLKCQKLELMADTT